jgi:hypothetical protein
MMTKDEEIAEAGQWRKGDTLARVWPTGEIYNPSAEGRKAGKSAAIAFRNALNRDDRHDQG